MELPDMPNSSERNKPSFLTTLSKHYGGSLTGVVLSALSAWTIVIGLKGLVGFEINQKTALADLLGIAIVIGVLRALKLRRSRDK